MSCFRCLYTRILIGVINISTTDLLHTHTTKQDLLFKCQVTDSSNEIIMHPFDHQYQQNLKDEPTAHTHTHTHVRRENFSD